MNNGKDENIYDMFNDMEIDLDQYENINIDLNDLEKKKIKKRVLKNVKSKKTKGKLFKIAGASVIICLGLGLGIPVVAKNVPAVNSIFEQINKKRGNNAEYLKYAENVSKSTTDKGITLTVNEALADDSHLLISYTLKSNNEVKKLIEDSNRPYFYLGNYIKINGKREHFSGGGSGEYKDENTFIGVCELDIREKHFSQKFNVSLDINDIYGVNGSWKLSFNVDRKEVLKNTVTFNPKSKVSFPKENVEIKTVSFSPVNTSIVIKGKYTQPKDHSNMREGVIEYDNWLVFTDKGEQLKPTGAHMRSGGMSYIFSDFNGEFNFEKTKEIPKSLKVIPIKYLYGNDDKKNTVITKDLKGSYPMEFKQTIGSIVIDKVEFKDDKTLIYSTVKGSIPDYQISHFNIQDTNENMAFQDYGDIKYNKVSDDKFIIEMPKLDKNKDYKIVVDTLEQYEIREDLGFDINLKK